MPTKTLKTMSWTKSLFYRHQPKIYLQKIKLLDSKKEIHFLLHKFLLKYSKYFDNAKKLDQNLQKA